MLKHVLVPLDGSELAEAALGHAANLVEPKGRITLVSAIEPPDIPVYGYYPPTTTPDYEDAMKNLVPYARHYLEGIAEKLTEQGFTVKTEVEFGDPAEVITRIAEKYAVETVVMSTHGRSGLSRWLFGSVTSKVLSAKSCPVYVIPSQQKLAS